MNTRNWWRKTVLFVLGLAGLASIVQCAGPVSSVRGVPVESIPPTIPIPTETTLPTPSPTMVPLHLSTITEIVQPTETFTLEGLYDDKAVGSIGVGEESQVVILDLNTGEMRQISTPVDNIRYKAMAHISARWVVWYEGFLEPVSGPGGSLFPGRLMVYDLDRRREFQLTDVFPATSPDLSGDIVVWDQFDFENRENGIDIFACDLAAGRIWSVTPRPHSQYLPHISGPWVIYLEDGSDPDLAQKYGPYADLRAHYLPSGEDFLIGQVPITRDYSMGTHHAIAGSKAVWIRLQPDPVSQLHVYDLENHMDRPLVLGDKTSVGAFLEPFGNNALIVPGGRIYSLEDGNLFATIDLSKLKGFIVRAYVSGNRVVLQTQEDTAGIEDVFHLYTLQLTR